MDERADVAIVGGALAGLVAGAILARHGRRIVVLEHADTVGGRSGAVRRPDGWWIDFGHRDARRR
jgi:monoamine oxidase